MNDQGNSRVWIMREVEESLRRLGTDHIDLYQIHRPEPDTHIEETLGALTDLQRQGKIRYFGSSTFPGWQMVEAQWVAERRGLVALPDRAAAVLDLRPADRARRACPSPSATAWGCSCGARCAEAGCAVATAATTSTAPRNRGPLGGAQRADWLAILFDESRPEVQRKLDVVEELVLLADEGRHHAPSPRDRVRARASGGDLGDRRASDDGAARGPASRRRISGWTTRRSTRSTSWSRPAPWSTSTTAGSTRGGSSRETAGSDRRRRSSGADDRDRHGTDRERLGRVDPSARARLRRPARDRTTPATVRSTGRRSARRAPVASRSSGGWVSTSWWTARPSGSDATPSSSATCRRRPGSGSSVRPGSTRARFPASSVMPRWRRWPPTS